MSSLYKHASLHNFTNNLILSLRSVSQNTYNGILWNHFYPWGSMFVGSQNLPGSMGSAFDGHVASSEK